MPEPVASLAGYLGAQKSGGGGLGVRLGGVTSLDESKETYSPALAGGVFFAGSWSRAGRIETIPYEFGLDAARLDSEDGKVKTNLGALRFDCMLPRWGSRLDSYVLGGITALVAHNRYDTRDDETDYVPGFNVGLGIASVLGGWDLRVTYMTVLGSGNVQELLLASVGFRF